MGKVLKTFEACMRAQVEAPSDPVYKRSNNLMRMQTGPGLFLGPFVGLFVGCSLVSQGGRPGDNGGASVGATGLEIGPRRGP